MQASLAGNKSAHDDAKFTGALLKALKDAKQELADHGTIAKEIVTTIGSSLGKAVVGQHLKEVAMQAEISAFVKDVAKHDQLKYEGSWQDTISKAVDLVGFWTAESKHEMGMLSLSSVLGMLSRKMVC